ncbi:MAG: DsbA family protein [Myxococcota bacterium]|nr:DsbA family protein [Myxococcota bacterium]
MSEAGAGTIRFYWSFRSPYAWMAAEALDSQLGDLGVPIESIPTYPTPELFPNDPVALPTKVAYVVQDVRRLARERGLTLRFPMEQDPDWSLSHAAFLGAEQLGAGHAFQLALFRKRFSEGLFLGDDDVIAAAAEEAGLPGSSVVEAAHDPALREQAAGGFQRGIEQDGIFGVPSFVFAGKLYWGQDRMHFVRSAVARKAGA